MCVLIRILHIKSVHFATHISDHAFWCVLIFLRVQVKILELILYFLTQIFITKGIVCRNWWFNFCPGSIETHADVLPTLQAGKFGNICQCTQGVVCNTKHIIC